jgi:hypothetical protein
MKNVNEIRKSFWASFPQFQQFYRKTWKQNQYCTDIRCSFVDYVDQLRKDNQISEKLANRATL